MPADLLAVVEPDYRFFAYANVGAERRSDLYLCDFEYTSGETLQDQRKGIEQQNSKVTNENN